MAGLPEVERPETRRVRGEHFVAEDHLPGLPRATKLQLRVGQDDSSLTGNRLGALVNREAEPPQLLRRLTTYDIHDMAEVDVLVMLSKLGLGSRREYRLRQQRAVNQAVRKRLPADRTSRRIVLKAGTGEVAANHALDGKHLQPLADKRAPRHRRGYVRRHDMVGHEVG